MYLRLFFSFFKASVMADLEYRANIAVKVVGDLMWYAAQISIFEVLFYQMPQVADWNLAKSRVFLGMLFVVDSLWMFLFFENVENLSRRVKDGELDLLLAKPVNSQFMVSLKKLNTPYVINFTLTSIYLLHALWSYDPGWSPFQLLWLIILIPCSILIVYSTRFWFTTLSVIFVNAEALSYVWYHLYRMGMRPDALYPTWLKRLLLTFLPMGFIASVPARIVMGEHHPEYIFGAVGISAFTLWISVKFWNYSLKHYSSASA